MKYLFSILVMLMLTGVSVFQVTTYGTATSPSGVTNLGGKWRIKFNLSGVGEKNLVSEFSANGAGSFLLLDSGPDNKPAGGSVPATWSQTTNDRVGFSGEVELPIGTCCREVGTLIFKGKIAANGSISGNVIFVGTTEDQENYNGYRSTRGTFTAVRMKD